MTVMGIYAHKYSRSQLPEPSLYQVKSHKVHLSNVQLRHADPNSAQSEDVK